MKEITPWKIVGQIQFTPISPLALIEYRVTNGSAYYGGESSLKVEQSERVYDIEGSLANLSLRQSVSEGFVVCQRGRVDEGMKELAQKVTSALERLW